MRRIIMATVIAIALIGAHAATASADVTELNVEITSATLLDPGHVLIEGTVTCDAPASFGYIDVSLRQRGGPFGFRAGYGLESMSCDTTPTPFSLVVVGGPFHGGPAVFDMFAVACDDFGQCAFDQSFGTLRISQ